MFHPRLIDEAAKLLTHMRNVGLRLVTAESCTGGLISALLTEIPGSSDVFERGFVTYSNKSKTTLLAVPASLIERAGAVSEEVAIAMARGALRQSDAHISIAVTGVAGPGGGTPTKPVGLVHIAAASHTKLLHVRKTFGDLSRSDIRIFTVEAALETAHNIIGF